MSAHTCSAQNKQRNSSCKPKINEKQLENNLEHDIQRLNPQVLLYFGFSRLRIQFGVLYELPCLQPHPVRHIHLLWAPIRHLICDATDILCFLFHLQLFLDHQFTGHLANSHVCFQIGESGVFLLCNLLSYLGCCYLVPLRLIYSINRLL